MNSSAYLTKGYVAGDFLIADDAAPVITRESATISNATATAVVYQAGSPMIVTNLGKTNATAVQALAGQEASVNALLLEKTTVLPNSTGTPVGLVARTPTGIDFNMLPTTDQTGASYTAATLKSTLGTLGIIVRLEGVTQQEQTT